MNTYTFHINFYDLAFLGSIFIGLTFAVLLWLTKTVNRSANKFLALALVTMILWMIRILAIDLNLDIYLPRWDWLPMQFLLALGPLMYFYVLKITRPEYKFRWRDLLHFSPLLLEQAALVLEIRESAKTIAPTYATHTFQQLNPVLQLLIFISIITYLRQSYKLIERFYTRLQPVMMDRSRLEFRWLRRLLAATALLWLFWLFCAAVDYFGYHQRPGTHIYYPFYIFFVVIIIWTAAAAFLKPQAAVIIQANAPIKPPVPFELRAKGAWLKKAMEAHRHYEDPELSLSSLAEKLNLHPHELSRVINTVFKKSFNDFVNEYRLLDMIAKMRDPAYDNITLMGIAYDVGFNSQSTYNRVFKQFTGKSAAEFKNSLKKQHSSYNLNGPAHFAAVISNHQTTPVWADLKLNRHFMFRNYLKVAWRHIMRHKVYSFINVTGLALGICACVIIYLIASFEFSFDNFHPGKDSIYCVDGGIPGSTDEHAHWNSVPGPMPAAMRRELTGMEFVAAFQHYHPKISIPTSTKQQSKKFGDDGKVIIAEPQYFNVFNYTWLVGNATTALAKPNSVVLTQSRAYTYFGKLPIDKIMGKTIVYDDSLFVTVTGVLQDWKGNSDFNYNDFISYSTIQNSFLKNDFPLDDWFRLNHSSQVIVKLAKGVKPAQVDAQFPAFAKRHLDPQPGFAILLKPLSGVHFHPEYGGEGRKANITVLYLLIGIAGFILLIAAINFINLSTAQSIQRAKEVGIRKVFGSGIKNLILQFLTETFILTLFAAIVALALIKPVMAAFAAYIPQGVKLSLTNGYTLLFFAGVTLFTTLVAGFYPAKVLSGYTPAISLKAGTAGSGTQKWYLRKSLTVFQFAISLIFIIASIVIGNQVKYMRTANLGFKTDAVITLPSMWGDQTGKMKVLAEEIRHQPGINKVILEAFAPMGRAHMGNGVQLKGSVDKPINGSEHAGNEDYVPFYGMKIVAGRNLLHSDSTREYLINEACARALGFTDLRKVVGKLLIVGGGDEAFPIAGVVADFHENSFHEQISPVVIAHMPGEENGIAIKLATAGKQAGEIKAVINGLEKQWKAFYPERPFEYAFLDDNIARLYESDLQTEWLMRTSMVVTIFISCLGLFGLAIFTAQKRTKEIGIRKVLGAGVLNILLLLSKEIVVLVVIALLVAAPVAWYFMHNWLQGFAYRINISLWMFVAAGFSALLIALATISFQAIKTALANPVKSLRSE